MFKLIYKYNVKTEKSEKNKNKEKIIFLMKY